MARPLTDTAARLPERSGVYLFRDARERVLYVGKARNLRSRVKQYLSGHDSRAMVSVLVAQAHDVDVVLTDTEKEALILEATLIKRYKPPYNVKLRDDKGFLHLRLELSQPWPRYELVRRIRTDGARYHGPYHSAQKARHTLAFLQQSFPMRTCSDAVLRSRSRPCLLHQMGRCVAPCVPGHTTPEAYRALVDRSLLLLEGRDTELTDRLHEDMLRAAAEERYEDAARLRDLVREIGATLERQKAMDRDLGDRDAWGLFREGDRVVLAVLPVREGQLLEPDYLEAGEAPGEPGELLSSWINAWYGEGDPIPPEILTPLEPEAAAELGEVLRERRGGRVELRTPQRGDKARLVALANDNARDRFRRQTDPGARRRAALSELAQLLGLPAPPGRVECFDNSNLQGTDPVASGVVFLDGAPAPRLYRHYRIRTVVGANDFASMNEVIARRVRRGVEEGELPDLLVVDGGRGQLGAARAALAELGMDDLPIIGLSKPRTERRRGETEAVDKIVLPGVDEPLRLPEHSPALNLLRHLRDEAHRFAITFHRRSRSRSTIASVLEEIPGIGPARRKALLRHFGSARAVLAASERELGQVEGVGAGTARTIWAALHPEPGAPPESAAPTAPGGLGSEG